MFPILGFPLLFLGGVVLAFFARRLPLSGKAALALTAVPLAGVACVFGFC